MCGFISIASIFPQTSHTWLSYGNNELIHRGPDGQGEWRSEDGRVGLAHRRPSVLDLSDSANHNGRLQKALHTITKVNLAQLINEEIMGSIL